MHVLYMNNNCTCTCIMCGEPSYIPNGKQYKTNNNKSKETCRRYYHQWYRYTAS